MSEARVERRLAAILAADVAGYSRLMGADEVGTLAALKAHRREIVDPAIAAHKGRIGKTTGDGMLVEFASVVDAVTCAVAVQEKMAKRTADGTEPRIQFRMGINVGDIIIDGDDIFGDGVNVAARVENECEPSSVYLSGNAFEQVRGKTNFAFDDLGETALKNISRPVRLYAARITTTPSAASVNTSAEARKPLPLPDKPSIAVLPFQNMSGDPEQEYFADGMVEDIITALSRIRWLFVIARNSAFVYKRKAVDIKEVGRELGVRYVLEGSIRKSSTRVRITAQLLDAHTAVHIWADRYDRDLSDVFAVQDEITATVATIIEPALAEAEQHRALRKAPSSLDAWEAYQRGLWHFYRYSLDDNKTAQTFFRRAMEIDPAFAPGHYGFAFAQHLNFWLFATVSWSEVTGLGLQEARLAVSLDDKDAMAHAALSFMRQMSGEWDLAISEGHIAIALNPNSIWSMVAVGHALGWGGYQREGVDYLRRAMRASPHDPLKWLCTYWTGIFHYFSREYEAAIDTMREIIHVRPAFAYRWIAAGLGQLNRCTEGKEAMEKSIAASAASFEAVVRQRPPWMRPDDYTLLMDGLRKAGWQG
jgi:adenylate cyclase